MDVRGYPTGPIDAKGAFTSGIDLSPKSSPVRSTPSPRRTARISSTGRACSKNICRCVTSRRPKPYPQAAATYSANMRTRSSTGTFLRQRFSR
jgi:hypothetical protein